jgi:hypothetical protein
MLLTFVLILSTIDQLSLSKDELLSSILAFSIFSLNSKDEIIFNCIPKIF